MQNIVASSYVSSSKITQIPSTFDTFCFFALKPYLVFVFIILPFGLLAQKGEIISLFQQLKSCETDSCRDVINKSLSASLESLLKSDLQLQTDLSDLPNCGVLLSKDKKVRVITWNSPIDTGGQKYYGFIQVYNAKFKKYMYFKLVDKSKGMDKPERAVLSPDKWFGCLYYNLLETGSGRKKVYTLLGWELGNNYTSKKVVEVLTVNPAGVPTFGGNYFQQYHKKQKVKAGNQDPGMPKVNYGSGKRNLLKARWIFEYKFGIQMKLNYDVGQSAILVPHLSPSSPSLVGQFQFYGPDLSVDALRWKAGKWVMYEDVDARNEK